MTIPAIQFPTKLDDATTLYDVKDTANIKLSKDFDYEKGDRVIYVENETYKMRLFPATGIITLTEQCSDPEYRAISFYYSSIDYSNFSFTDLTLLDETKLSSKKAIVTSVTLNVTAQHHNNIKNAIIETEKYVGIKTDRVYSPFTGNLVAKSYYLASIIFKPRAWFSAKKTVGLSPFTVEFTNYSFLLGEKINNNTILSEWDFGDGNKQTVINDLQKKITHTYTKPGVFDVTLKITNMFGSDTVTFKKLINAKYESPEPATIEEDLSTGQLKFLNFTRKFCPEDTASQTQLVLSQYLKTTVNLPVNLRVPIGIRPDGEFTYAGERVDSSNVPIDRINTFTWSLGDNLSHGNSLTTTALYSIGGFYNIVLRTDTDSLAYRITTDENRVNVTEVVNAWLFNKCTSSLNLNVYEMGFLSEVFKTAQRSTALITANDGFLNGYTGVNSNPYKGAKLEFARNININTTDSKTSGLINSSAIIAYASGRNQLDALSSEKIKAVQFSGFNETFTAYNELPGRPWNWIAFNGNGITRFMFGNSVSQPINTNDTNMDVTKLEHLSGVYVVEETYSPGDFLNAATYLKYNVVSFDSNGLPVGGNYSMYRSAFRNSKGYILKNITTGNAFQLKGFYVSENDGVFAFAKWNKLPDLAGPKKAQAQLVNLQSGLFLFNNSGSVLQFDDVANAWRTGGPGYNSIAFSNLQDKSVLDYEDEDNSLLATTDNDNNAYLSFDYSSKAYIKFNDIDLSFKLMNARPTGSQWFFGTY